MPSIAHEMPQRPSRVAEKMHATTAQEFADFMDEYREDRQAAADYSVRQLRTNFVAAAEYEAFYLEKWRVYFPTAPQDPWQAQSSQQLADRIMGYLSLRRKLTKGQDPSGKIAGTTLRAWARDVYQVADYNIRGRGSVGHNRNVQSVTGALPDRSDNLHDLLQTAVSSHIQKHQLPRHRRPGEFYGRLEAALLLDAVDARIIRSLEASDGLLQSKFIIQFASLVCVRPVSILAPSAGSLNTLLQRDVVIRQPRRGYYAMDLTLYFNKGQTEAHNPSAPMSPTVPETTRLCDSKFDALATILPLLIARGDLYELNPHNDAQMFFEDLDAFLNSDSAVFFLRDNNLPLFRACDGKRGGLSEKPMIRQNFHAKFVQFGIDAGLPGAHLYALRRGHGDRLLIATRPGMQRTGLGHGAVANVGELHYSNATNDLPTANLLLENFDDGGASLEKRLQASSYYVRERSGRAVQAWVRLKLGLPGAPSPTDPEAQQAIQTAWEQSSKYQQALTDLAALGDIADADEQGQQAILVARSKLRQCKQDVADKTMRQLVDKWRRAVPRRPICTVQQQNAAYEEVRSNASAPSRLLSPHDAVYQLRTMDFPAEFERATTILDGMRIEEEEPECEEDEAWEDEDEGDEATDPAALTARPSAQTDRGGKRKRYSGSGDQERDKRDERDERMRLPARPEDEAGIVSSAESDAVVRQRVELMKAHWKLLVGINARKTLENFMMLNQYCPYCSIGLVGAVQPTLCGNSAAGNLGIKWSTGPMGKPKPEVPAITQHFKRSHPDVWESVNRDNVLPPFISDFCLEHIDHDVLARVGVLLSGSQQAIKETGRMDGAVIGMGGGVPDAMLTAVLKAVEDSHHV